MHPFFDLLHTRSPEFAKSFKENRFQVSICMPETKLPVTMTGSLSITWVL